MIQPSRLRFYAEVTLLMVLFFVYAGDPPPMVNESHYLVKAKNFWNPDWCANDLFAASGKAHTTFYVLFGWPTRFVSLEATAWIGRVVGWLMIAIGLRRLSLNLIPQPWICIAVAVIWIAGIERGNLAGEWVIGGIEAKVPAYGLMIFALSEMVVGRWNRVWILLGAASALHVLSGGWAVIAAMFAWYLTEKRALVSTQVRRTKITLPREGRGGACDDAGRGQLARWVMTIRRAIPSPKPRTSASTLPKEGEERSVDTHASRGEVTEAARPASVSQRLFTPALLLGGAIALFGLLPAFWLTSGVSNEDSLAAARIYSYFRIKHHLLPADFLLAWYVRHGILIAMTMGLGVFLHRRQPSDSWSRMYAFTLGAVLIAIAGLFVGLMPSIAPDLGAKLLRYYWFRLSDAIVPLMFALLVARLTMQGNGLAKVCGLIGIATAIVLVGWSSFDRGRLGVPPSASNRLLGWDAEASAERQRAALEDWVAVCAWAHTATADDAVFLTPRHQQTFKWYAQRAEVVNWKDVPQDAKSLRQWYRRFREVFPTRLGTIRVTIQYQQLGKFREKYGVDFMIVDRRVTGTNLPLVKVYPTGTETNETYAVYELPKGR